MWCAVLFIWLFAMNGCTIQAQDCSITAKGSPNFPSNFSFGVATSAYQVEGAWDADGKGPSIWDEYLHKNKSQTEDEQNGDIATDSYHRFDQDLEILKELKVKFYRFSIAWTRIYPDGDISSKNQKGIDYYNEIIDKLLANGIEPMVTMVHFDIPAEMQKVGGVTNQLFITQFVTYAIELFENFGDRVKSWITFNEPFLFCRFAYGSAQFPPYIDSPGNADYQCMSNTLKAHAAAYRVYKSKYYEKQQGKVGIAYVTQFVYSNDDELVKRSMYYNMGFLANPVFSKTGGYPDLVETEIKRNSFREGRLSSRLPSLEGKWKETIKGSADFFGINYYSSRIVKRTTEPYPNKKPSWKRDYDCDEFKDPNWKRSVIDWLWCAPEGLEDLLKFIRDEYDNPEVIITENGWGDKGHAIDDHRIHYIQTHLQAVLNAINDGCNVSGYTYWALQDTFEWFTGYKVTFGLYAVNRTSPNMERTPRKSSIYYKEVIKTYTIPKEVPKTPLFP